MRFIGIAGVLVLVGLAFIFSSNRSAVKFRIIAWGMGLQFLFALIILSESWLSWLGMFLFFYLILLYVFRPQPEWSAYVQRSLILIPIGMVVTFVGYLVDAPGWGYYLAGLLIVTAIILNLFKFKAAGKYIGTGLLFLFLGILLQRGLYGKDLFASLSNGVADFLKLTDVGSIFLFGNLAKPEFFDQFGYQFAFSVLPTIIFFSAIMSILYYMGVMQVVVKAMAKFMRWTMGTSGAETLSCSANIFVGQTEAPFLIKPFIPDMTESELHAIMVGGFATIAGGVLAGYIRLGVNAGHLIAASVMSAPAALAIAKTLLPETKHSKTAGDVEIPKIKTADNLLDATTQGVTDGLKLAVNVGAMLLAFLALVAMVDAGLGYIDKLVDFKILGGAFNEARGEYAGIFPGSLKTILGTLFSPLAFVIGVPWKDALDVGNLMGIKVAVNEFVGYAELGKHIQSGDLSPRAITIATYALCGFANLSSIGIQIGGISALVPSRRSDLSRVALRAMCGGALASWMTAAIAGMLI